MKINKGTAAALVVLVLGIAALAAWGEQLGMSEGSLRWVQGAAGCVGALVMALLPKLFHDGNGDGIPDIVQRGSMLLVLALGAAVACTGCGASALAGQARAASVVGVGLGSMRQELHDARAHDLDGCAAAADTDACLDTREAAWAPVVALYESARATLSTWIEAIDVARVAGDDDHDVIGALVVAAVRLARQWRELAAALHAAGVEVPTIPASLAALLPPDGGST